MDQELFDRAVRLHQAMALDEAEALYRQVVTDDPGCAEAWRRLAVIAAQRGRYDEVADRLARVVVLDPGDADAGADLGVALQASGA